MLSPFECLCGNFILPEPASYVFFYALFNLRKLLYIIDRCAPLWTSCGRCTASSGIRDIRETHKKDSESAPQTTVADELKENLEAVENFKGSRDEKLVVPYCKQLGINYKNLSDEEFRWLIRILKKSKKMGTPISQRKKR